ncbi:MAG TPA: site-specific DNA-methyltransferase [Thermoplasmata archaeon]|nr:site-specific DNA-methyltransferase [Thermoplasmata archaeon]
MRAPGPRTFARLLGPHGIPITLRQGDALRGIPRDHSAGSVDVLVTSPPYNLGADYGRYDDARPSEEYLRWIGRFGRCVERVLAEDGSFFLNLGGPPSDPGWPWEVARSAGRGFVLQNVVHWVKSIAIERASAGRSSGLHRDLAIGHYKPVNSSRYLNSAHEYVFHFTHRGDVPLDRLAIGVPYQDRSNVTRWGAGRSGLRCRGNTWFLPYRTIRSRATDRPHPATFPPELPEFCLRLHGRERIRVALDPFLGIGSSALAALRVEVPFEGYEIDATYLEEATRSLVRAGAKRAEGGGNLARSALETDRPPPIALTPPALPPRSGRPRREAHRPVQRTLPIP